MSELDLAAQLHATIDWTYQNLVNDLNALDEGQATGTADARTRPAIQLVAECASVNRLLAGLLATGELSRPSPEEREAFAASITTRAEALAALESATQQLQSAISGIAPDRWGEIVQGVFGPATLLATAGIASHHMMYHDGQINYVHLLNGDSEMHWK